MSQTIAYMDVVMQINQFIMRETWFPRWMPMTIYTRPPI